jgi:hypothetical protein
MDRSIIEYEIKKCEERLAILRDKLTEGEEVDESKRADQKSREVRS